MDGWQKFLGELAKRLTPPLAFGLAVLVVLGLLGERIPAQYVTLVYLLSLSAPVLWAGIEIMLILKARRDTQKTQNISQKVRDGDQNVLVAGERNYIQYIIQNYFSDSSSVSPDKLEEQLKKYLEWVKDSFGTITLRGIEQGGRQVVNLPLETVYVPLSAQYSPEMDFSREMGRVERRLSSRNPETVPDTITLNRVLKLEKKVIITGGPGSGKTTVLQHIAWTLADAWLTNDRAKAKEKLGVENSLPLPVYVPLSLYASYLRNLPKSASAKQRQLATYISEYLLQRQMHMSLDAEFIARLIDHEQDIILLLDGLDEVPNENERVRVRQAIEDLVAGRKSLRVIVTSRTAAYRGGVLLRDFSRVSVLPLEWGQVQDLIFQAYRSIFPPELEGQALDRAGQLVDQIAALEAERRQRLGKDVEPFVDSPLKVRMLLIVHFNYRKLPDQRADLYCKVVDAMLRPDYNLDQAVTEELERHVAGSLPRNREMLQHLAYHMHEMGEKQGREVDETTLRRILAQEATYAPYVEELIAETNQRGTLLEERGGMYRFIHLSFQEFLVARYFVEMIRDLEKIVGLLEAGLALDSWWREPVLLTAGYLDLTAPTMARRFLLRLAGMDENASPCSSALKLDMQLALAELAGRAYLECKSQSPDLAEVLRKRLLDLHRHGKLEPWTPVLMAAAADVLDELGYVPEDLYDFIPIPDAAAPKFFIARYPVTNLQYERFLKSGQFGERRWWVDFPMFDEKSRRMPGKTWGGRGWKWLQAALKDADKSVREGVLYPRLWDDPRFGIARRTAPVVGISWYEANAYCRWLAAQGGLPERAALARLAGGAEKPEIRLPTEAEWVEAAGGEEGDRFAWGGLENPEKEIVRFANTKESGIGRTTPVWMYPQGKSPRGVMDLSGNVWEWQANFYDKDHDVLSLRGGSWGILWLSALVAARGYAPPLNLWSLSGFRIVAALK